MSGNPRGSALLKALREKRRRQQEQDEASETASMTSSVTDTASTVTESTLTSGATVTSPPTETSSATPSSTTSPTKSRAVLLAKLRQRRAAVQSKDEGSSSSPATSQAETVSSGLAQLKIDYSKKTPKTESPPTSQSLPSDTPESGDSDRALEAKRSRAPEVREPVAKRGSSGTPLQLGTNSIILKLKPGAGIWEYHVSFDPQLDKKEERFACVNSQKEVLGSIKMFRDSKLILPKKLDSEDLTLTCSNVQVGQGTVSCTMKVSLLWCKSLGDPDCIFLYNILLAKVFTCPELQMCSLQKAPGKAKRPSNSSHFDPKRKQTLEKHGLEIWPGYVSVIGHYEGGVHLQIDTVSKVLRTRTCLETITECFKKSGASGYKEAAVRALVGCTVITRYNNRTYKIDDIDWSKSPKDEFTDDKGIPSTFVDYYNSRYGLKIKDVNQPMLIHLLNRPELDDPIKICFVPELCFPVGLTDAQIGDFRVMKDVAEITRLPPARRLSSVQELIKTLNSSPAAAAKLAEWGLEICPDVVTLQARKLDPVTLHFGGGAKESVGERGDWMRAATTKPVLDHRVMDKWAIVYQSRDEKIAKTFCQSLVQQCPKMGIQVRNPKTVSLPQDKTENYLKAIRELPDNGQLVVLIFGGTMRADRYAAVKKLCCGEKPIASQVVMQKTLSNEKRLQSVVQKIALQINCKLGGALWGIHVPIQDLMVIGIDCYKDGSGGSAGGLVTAVVSSQNSSFSKYHSSVFFHSNKSSARPEDQYQAQIERCVGQSIEKYREGNGGRAPSSVVVYRDGVRGASDYASAGREGEAVAAAIRSATGEGVEVSVTYVLVERAGGATKFFVKDRRSGKVENPPGGTVIDHTVTLREWYDFYLVSMSVSQGTVNPTHFVVVHDDSKLAPDALQKLTYALTHMYFNWTGVIKVPAPCQYSRKLAMLVGDHVHKKPNPALESNLFYL